MKPEQSTVEEYESPLLKLLSMPDFLHRATTANVAKYRYHTVMLHSRPVASEGGGPPSMPPTNVLPLSCQKSHSVLS